MKVEARDVAVSYRFQKRQIAERFRLNREPPTVERLLKVSGAELGKIASLLEELMIPPRIAMAACFDLAARNKHMDGPMLRMISRSYLVKALALHLQLPSDAVLEAAQAHNVAARVEEDWLEAEAELKRWSADFPDDFRDRLEWLGSIPALFRLHFAGTLHAGALRAMGAAALQELQDQPKLEIWYESKGGLYERLAKVYNHFQQYG